jgi:hypothetical protein
MAAIFPHITLFTDGTSAADVLAGRTEGGARSAAAEKWQAREKSVSTILSGLLPLSAPPLLADSMTPIFCASI